MFTQHMNRKAHVACNLNCLFENEVHIKVTASHVHCKCGNISEMMEDGVVGIVILHNSVHRLQKRNGSADRNSVKLEK